MSATHTVLLVDDEPNILKSLQRLMLGTGYEVLMAESGEAGLEMLAHHATHLVISDYRMQGMNGVEFLARVKEEYPETMRLILSGFADATAIVEAINDGQVYKFMPKPWDDQELLITVKRALEQYSLQQENARLYEELRTRNIALEEMMATLETKVEKRTRDIEMKNRALKVAHSILDIMPIGVIGIDTTEMVVYMNRSLGDFVSTENLGLARSARGTLDDSLLEVMMNVAKTGEQAEYCLDDAIIVICTPLLHNAGAIGSYINHKRICAKGNAPLCKLGRD